VLTVAIVVGAYFFLAQEREPTSTEQEPGGILFPSSGGLFGEGTKAQTRSLTLATGKRIVVKDFLANGITFEDPANSGSYFLAGKLEYCLEDGTCPDTNTPSFSVLFIETDQSFSISLNEEPLKSSRVSVEQYLMNVLGMSEDGMCDLQYSLGTTVSVNETYGSINNLGFSFCEGAIPLP
ncbi:MAG: hypothetical protein Q8O19_06565, partial [Rectinemataceae bacterium]|nr:hypothetical protein [Rectinemataceae bacterium]